VQGLPHPLYYAWEIWHNLMMPQPQHPDPARLEAARACHSTGAPWRGVVLGSIDLNCQSHCGARAIPHAACDGVLPAKAATVQLLATEAWPKAVLRVGHMLAQVTRSVQEGRWDGSETACAKTLMALLMCDNV
jgi:hypothetical protein